MFRRWPGRHPSVEARRRVDVAVRIGQVLTHHLPLDVSSVDSLANGEPIGITVREKFSSTIRRLYSRANGSSSSKSSGRKPVSPANSVDFFQTLPSSEAISHESGQEDLGRLITGPW
jgi:hypothetical protein